MEDERTGVLKAPIEGLLEQKSQHFIPLLLQVLLKLQKLTLTRM